MKDVASGKSGNISDEENERQIRSSIKILEEEL
jgi:hypothetical protein